VSSIPNEAAATRVRIQPNASILDNVGELWVSILSRTFPSDSYNADAEIDAHRELTGASAKGSYLILNNKYALDPRRCTVQGPGTSAAGIGVGQRRERHSPRSLSFPTCAGGVPALSCRSRQGETEATNSALSHRYQTQHPSS